MIPLVAPTITQADKNYLSRRIHTDLLETETEVEKFEEAFAAYVGTAGCVTVSSGTTALVIALQTLGWQGTVNLPSYTCRALLDATWSIGLDQAFVDNPSDVRHAQYTIVPPAGNTILSHMFGTAGARHNYGELLEDITLSLGAVPTPRYGVCSFAPDKMITTGRGGAIISTDRAFLEAARELARYDQPHTGRYTPAHSTRMSSLQAALGNSQLKQLPAFILRRQHLALQYSDAFNQLGITVPNPDCGVFFRYLIPSDRRDHQIRQLHADGIQAGRGVSPPLHRALILPDTDYPNASWCSDNLLSLPVHPGVTDKEADHIIHAVSTLVDDARTAA